MKATTHTEVYRRFEGELRRHPLRPLTIAWSGIRSGFKRKLPALLLYLPVGIGCIIAAFRVHFMFTLQSGELLSSDDPRAAMAQGAVAQVLGDVVDNIFLYIQSTAFFALIAVAWYGAGMIAEDRRLGANLLYFSRPITRFDYLAGKFLSAAAFGVLALTIPCLVVCGIACFSSPEWSFLTQEWTTILLVLAYSLLWVATVTVVVLAVSSMVNRKTMALVGVVGFVFLTGAVSKALARLFGDRRFSLLSLFDDFQRVGEAMFGRLDGERQISVEASVYALLALWVVCLAVLAHRVRKMEVVA